MVSHTAFLSDMPTGCTVHTCWATAASDWSVRYGIYFVSIHSFVLMVAWITVLTVSRCTDSVTQAINRLIRLLQDLMTESNDWQTVTSARVLVQQLEEDKSFCYTGWRLFVVNRSLILSFLSSIVTFSVLLIQVASKWL